MTRRNLYHAPRSSLGRSPKLPPAKRLRGNGTPGAILACGDRLSENAKGGTPPKNMWYAFNCSGARVAPERPYVLRLAPDVIQDARKDGAT